MDKQQVIETLNKHGRIIIETIEHDRIKVSKVEDNDDKQYIHVLEPKEQTIEVAKITDVQENNFNQL
ncbi:hypothetical protein OWI77_05435 [Staphylococcus nepalensis]|uniref:hypothetical protein n=1 Tax=Staphylococcus nepalensis TaxID=214473 RepID=UPI002270ADF4|nr:hypothetical protein [Staphylococcus nepalensis]MCY1038263.1 hypothetical protein [Staphylococcus nepalensis]